MFLTKWCERKLLSYISRISGRILYLNVKILKNLWIVNNLKVCFACCGPKKGTLVKHII